MIRHSDIKHRRSRRHIVTTGLRTATAGDIQELRAKYEALGYKVTHVTKNLPHNGVLKCER